MDFALSPVAALDSLIKLDRKVALPLVAGLAILAVAAIAGTWDIDVPTMGLMGLYVAALGAFLIILANVVRNPLMGKVLGWFLVVLIMAVVSCFFVSAVFRQQGVIAPTYCLVRFWEACKDAEADVVERNAARIEATQEEERGTTQVLPPPPPSPRGDGQDEIAFDINAYKVYIQFAGLLTRDTITQLNTGLQSYGWQMDGTSGERIATAQGLNEVRYAPGHKPAAEALAATISETKITSSPVTVREVKAVRDSVLEVWISN